MVETEQNTAVGETLKYVYDSAGRVTQVLRNNTVVYKYTYDETTGFLVREDNADAGKSYVYTYDEMGNILNRYSYAFTTGTLGSLTGTKTWYNGTRSTFGKLCYGIDGQDDLWIDSFGNPYYNQETCEAYTWNGRELTSYDTGHDEYYYYSYNSDGIRTKKVYSSYDEQVSTYYIIDGTQILGEICSDGSSMNYFYDENGSPVALSYNNSATYYYYKNIFGDILGIMDSCGNVVVRYYYDAWGNIISTTGSMASTLGRDNPFRYRGYYYDTETGFYYLNARYYNPEWGRFISADIVLDTERAIGCNLFAYCFNDPINYTDHNGNWPEWIKNTVKWVAKNIVKPVVKTTRKALSNDDFTYSTGFNVSGTPSIFIFNFQAGISIDAKGNFAIQGSAGGGVTGGSPGASITAYQNITNAPSIDKLEGPGYQIGGSVGVPVYGVPLAVGGDFNIIPDSALNTKYHGVTSNVGFGTPGGEVHIEWGETATWKASQFNIFDLAEDIYIKIMEW